MPKKPATIDASTLVATKAPAAIAGSLQRGQTVTETLVDLNFKVPPEFRHQFKQLALDAGLKNVQLLMRAVEAWKRQGQELNHRNGRAG